MTSLTKKLHPTGKKFFFRVQATRLAVSFQLLTGSVALTGPEKFPRKTTCVSVFFSRKSLKVTGRQSVKIYLLNLKVLIYLLSAIKQVSLLSSFDLHSEP